MPGGGDGAVAGDHNHHIEPGRAAQRIDRLLRRLRDGTCDIERGVDRQFDADMAAERFQDRVGERIVFAADDLDTAGGPRRGNLRRAFA